MVEISTFRVMPITGSVIGLYETVTNGSVTLALIVKVAFLNLKELYLYARGLNVRLASVQLIETQALISLNDRVYRIFKGMITIVPIAGGLVRNRMENRDAKALSLYKEGEQLEVVGPLKKERKERRSLYKQADEIYTESAALGNHDALYKIGDATYRGILIGNDLEYKPKDEKEGLRCLLAAKRNMISGYKLSDIYADKKEEGKAFTYCKKSALQGYDKAQTRLGNIYEKGLFGQKIDLALAAFWYEQAAKNKDVEGIISYAECLMHGKGVKQDGQQAFKTLEDILNNEKNTAEQLGKANYLLGVILRDHISDVGKNFADNRMARLRFELAANNGHEDAKKALAQLK